MISLNDILKSNVELPLFKKTAINFIVTSNFFMEHLQSFFKSYDISMQQYNVLRILRGQKGKPANLATVQERMIHKNSNTTRLIDKLITKEYVERSICPNNRRKVEIVITKSGMQLLETIDPELNTIETQLFQSLTQEEINTFNSILEKIRGSQSS
ncbi:MarR family winged helix-turn-helix transcriptional regulator [Kordia zhangzhouensis]|uniref:MarR family winged helix-turn-helix transcriptional regulator n=1 Tax=Kordia zhangzhouensis TaxID=1620405 RepID=UPI000AED1D18|nr:MarR family transcriptional regulator [Kordia zhangzhouensis]